MLHLAHDVVAEVADHPGVEGRELGELRGTVGAEQLLERGEHAVGAVGRDRQRARPRQQPPVGDDGGKGGAADKGVAAPAFAALDGFEQEAVGFADDVQIGGDGRQRVGDHLAEHGNDGVLHCEGCELLEARAKLETERRVGNGSAHFAALSAGTPGP